MKDFPLVDMINIGYKVYNPALVYFQKNHICSWIFETPTRTMVSHTWAFVCRSTWRGGWESSGRNKARPPSAGEGGEADLRPNLGVAGFATLYQ